MEHTWAKIKSWIPTYLSSWKTTNFGTGTYSNNGSITVPSNLDVSFAGSQESTKTIKIGKIFSIGCWSKKAKSLTLETENGICYYFGGMPGVDLTINLAEGVRDTFLGPVFFYTFEVDVKCLQSTSTLGLGKRSTTIENNGMDGILVW